VANHHRVVPNSGFWVLSRLDAGVVGATLVTGPAITPGGGDTYEISDDGTTISLYINGTLAGSATDTTRNTLTKVGIQGQFNNDPVSRVDTFAWSAARIL
jgi:hypothetical protein